MKPAISLFLSISGFLLAGCGSLSVTPYSNSSQTPEEQTPNGVPVYMTQHEFTITEWGMNDDGKETDLKEYRITMARRPDYNRGFLINNSPGLFSSSEFSIERGNTGTLVSVSGSSSGGGLGVIQALGSLLVSTAAPTFAPPQSILPPANSNLDKLRAEKESQSSALDRLREGLKTAHEYKTIDGLQSAIKATSERIEYLSQKIKSLEATPKPTKPTRIVRDVKITTTAPNAEMAEINRILNKETNPDDTPKFVVILTPINH